MTRDIFSESYAMLCECFGREVSPLAIEGYYAVLSHLTEQEMQSTVVTALQTLRFMPSSSELLAIARPVKVRDATAAVKELRQGFLRFGRNKTPHWSDTAIGDAVDSMGGWGHLCNMDQINFDRYAVREFSERYLSAPGTEVVKS